MSAVGILPVLKMPIFDFNSYKTDIPNMKPFALAFLTLLFCSCAAPKNTKIASYSDLIDKVKNIKDSISVGKMTIHNAYKSQLLAHHNGRFDSTMILKKVYQPNKHVFDSCLSQIFGEENGKKFKPEGLYMWNRKLLAENESLIRQKLAVLDSVNVDQLFTKHLNALQKITGQQGEGKWLVYFGPKGFQIFGGCDNNAMILDMFGSDWTMQSIDKVFAHELEHLLFNPILEKDPNGRTGLGITLDEGLAAYFTSLYLNQSQEEALYGKNTQILLDREKEIFEKLEPYFYKTNEEGCPIFRHCGRNSDCKPVVEGLPKEAENELCYFLGFRIIQHYVAQNGKDSWKDIYTISLKDFFEKSGYKEYIQGKRP